MHCYCHGKGIIEAVAGKEQRFTIVSNDKFGNSLTTGGLDFVCALSDSSEKSEKLKSPFKAFKVLCDIFSVSLVFDGTGS
jgi:hypothetical protein